MTLFKFNPSETLSKVSEVFISKPKQYKMFILYYQYLELKLKKYFEELIISTLLTDDYIVEKLDDNEFGLKNNVIYKKDLIDEHTHYGELSDTELKRTLTKEFEKFFIEILDESKIVTDVENHLNIYVEIDSSNSNVRVCSIYIRYWRTDIVNGNRKMINKALIKYAIAGSILITLAIIAYNLILK